VRGHALGDDEARDGYETHCLDRKILLWLSEAGSMPIIRRLRVTMDGTAV